MIPRMEIVRQEGSEDARVLIIDIEYLNFQAH